MKLLLENWREFLNEEVYSGELLDFIQYTYELQNAYPKSPQKQLDKIQAFLKKHFEQMGDKYSSISLGAFRQVYQTNEGELIKAVHQVKYAHQNKKEISIFNRDYYGIFPKVLEYDKENYLWFIVEKLNVIGSDVDLEHTPQLFPKLFNTLKPIIDQTASWGFQDYHLYDVLVLMLKYKVNQRVSKGDVSDFVKKLTTMTKFKDKIDKNPELHKELVDALFEYMKNPDPNYERLNRATKEFNIVPDFHSKNLAYKGDDIYIIDAGL